MCSLPNFNFFHIMADLLIRSVIVERLVTYGAQSLRLIMSSTVSIGMDGCGISSLYVTTCPGQHCLIICLSILVNFVE